MNLQAALARILRPLHLTFAAITYLLGTGAARYLGASLDANIIGFGLLIVELVVVSLDMLAGAFATRTESYLEDWTLERRDSLRKVALYISVAALASLGLAAFAINSSRVLSMSALICVGAMVLVALLHSVPPTRLVERGYGELLVAVQVAYLAPSLGFTLQSSSPHVLLIICSVALSVLLIACLVAIDFSTFAADVKHGRSTILTRLGWEKALILHHVLIVVAYVFIASAAPLGFSLGLMGPAFLAVPFAALQVFLLQRLSAGAKPLWRLLTANATAVFGLTAYFLTLSFWLR